MNTMTKSKADILHEDISETDILRIASDAEDRLRAQNQSVSMISLSYLKFAFASGRPPAMPDKTADKPG